VYYPSFGSYLLLDYFLIYKDGSSVRRWRVRRGEVAVAGPGGVLRLDWEQREEEEGR